MPFVFRGAIIIFNHCFSATDASTQQESPVRLPLTAIYEFKNDRLLERELDSTHANLYLRVSMMHPGKLQDSIYQPSGLLDVDHDIVWGQQKRRLLAKM